MNAENENEDLTRAELLAAGVFPWWLMAIHGIAAVVGEAIGIPVWIAVGCLIAWVYLGVLGALAGVVFGWPMWAIALCLVPLALKVTVGMIRGTS